MLPYTHSLLTPQEQVHPYLPNVDHEIEHYAEFQWAVHNFSELRMQATQDPDKRKVYSDNFPIGKDHW